MRGREKKVNASSEQTALTLSNTETQRNQTAHSRSLNPALKPDPCRRIEDQSLSHEGKTDEDDDFNP
jgi:hypothetical protein